MGNKLVSLHVPYRFITGPSTAKFATKTFDDTTLRKIGLYLELGGVGREWGGKLAENFNNDQFGH